jgi:GntR family transcriptional regulator / MocR family aminotransferase
LAYERLISEGYLETHPGIGTFVSNSYPESKNCAFERKKDWNTETQASLYPSLFQDKKSPSREDFFRYRIDFGAFHADPALLPVRDWGRKMQAVIAHHSLGLAEYPPQAGVLSLRLAIAEWLAMHRNIIVSPEQVIVIAGRQQARHLVAKLFLRPGDNVVVEAPCQADVADLFEAVGANLIPVPVDDQGIKVDLLPEGRRVHMAYVTPNHQRPIGGALSLQRRELLMEWARRSGCYIIEDDCDGKFRYHGLALPSLAALDTYGLVFHVGTFSKTLGAGLCLGYLVTPPEFVEPAIYLKTVSSKGCSWIDQTVLANFISGGDYDQHLRRMRKVYMDRRNCLMEAIKSSFGEVQLIGTETGTQLTCMLPQNVLSAQAVQKVARAQGVNVRTLADAEFIKQRTWNLMPESYLQRAIMLGYSTLNEQQIREGISILSHIIGQ